MQKSNNYLILSVLSALIVCPSAQAGGEGKYYPGYNPSDVATIAAVCTAIVKNNPKELKVKVAEAAQKNRQKLVNKQIENAKLVESFHQEAGEDFFEAWDIFQNDNIQPRFVPKSNREVYEGGAVDFHRWVLNANSFLRRTENADANGPLAEDITELRRIAKSVVAKWEKIDPKGSERIGESALLDSIADTDKKIIESGSVHVVGGFSCSITDKLTSLRNATLKNKSTDEYVMNNAFSGGDLITVDGYKKMNTGSDLEANMCAKNIFQECGIFAVRKEVKYKSKRARRNGPSVETIPVYAPTMHHSGGMDDSRRAE